MRKSSLEKREEARRAKKATPKTITTYDELLEVLTGGPLNPTQRQVLTAPPSIPVIGYMGRAGAAKTSTGVGAVMARALLEPGSSWFIGRFNYNDHKDSTMKRAMEMLGRLPAGTLLDRSKEPPEKWVLDPIPLREENPEPSTITFLSFDVDPEEIGSTEYNGGFFDEADELLNRKVFEAQMARCMGRKKDGGPTLVICAFNGPSKDHWLYTACTGLDARGQKVPGNPIMKLYQPAFGENAQNLGEGYYDNLKRLYANSPDMMARLVAGEWVSTFKGRPVYPEFRRDWHVKHKLPFEPYAQLYRFWDFGYNQPRCIWAQPDAEGRLLVLHEEVRQQVEIRPFSQLCKSITRTHFPAADPPIDFGDPAARQKKDTGSTLVHLAQEGITLRYVLAGIDAGLRTVRNRLNMAPGGQPAVQIDDSCIVLIDALAGGYRMRESSGGVPQEPLKDGYYDNSADCFRYGLTNLYGFADERDPKQPYAGGYDLPANVSYQEG